MTDRPIFYIIQGASFEIFADERNILKNLVENLGASDESRLGDKICSLPPKKVGILKLPSRIIVIMPRHEGVNIQHIIRMYYFINNASSLDSSDSPDYIINDQNIGLDVTRQYVEELREVVRKGIVSSYIPIKKNLNYIKGKINYADTLQNLRLRKKYPVVSEIDEITTHIKINKVLSAALVKIKDDVPISDFIMLSKSLPKSSIEEALFELETIVINNSFAYYRKALNLAKIILKELSYVNLGIDLSGSGFLVDYDSLFEMFIKSILIYHSGNTGFSFWTEDIKYAEFQENYKIHNRSYRPDLLYQFTKNLIPKAFGIIDVKNKMPNIFSNSDIYQIEFYSVLLDATKLILVYPSTEIKGVKILELSSTSFKINRIYAVHIKITGNESNHFAKNIKTFCQEIIEILHS